MKLFIPLCMTVACTLPRTSQTLTSTMKRTSVRVPKCIHRVKEKRLITQLFDTKLPF